MNYYANTTHQDLKEHLNVVAKTTKRVISTCLNNFNTEMTNKVEQASEYSALHHDDGKADQNFQDYLATKKVSANFFELNPLHHELSLLTLDHFIGELDSDVQKAVHFAIYYHHAEQRRKTAIKNIITDYIEFGEYHNNISNFYDIEFKQSDLLKVASNYSAPDFFNPYKMRSGDKLQKNLDCFKQRLDQDILNHLTKFVLVTADRYVSKQENLASVVEWTTELDDTRLRNAILEYKNLEELQGERTDNQIDAASQIGDHGQNTVLAGAGSGKSRIALLGYEMKSKGKGIMWVCPRTAVCGSLLDELSKAVPSATLSMINGDGELCYQGGIQVEGNAWQADIIVTTIDQVVSTLARHTNVENFKEFLTRFVVFDEYHETLDILELYYATMLLMRIKEHQDHSHVNISATPAPFHLMCVNAGYSDNWKHPVKMVSFNDKPVTINFVEKAGQALANTVYVYNTAKSAQESAIARWLEDRNDFMLYHSRYNAEDRSTLTSKLLSRFGKGSDHDDILYSSPLCQASLNISRKNLVSELTSPSNALQRLGRLNRFAEHEQAEAFFIVDKTTAKDFSKGEVKNTNSYEFKIVKGKVVSTYKSFYARSSFDFYLNLCRKLTGKEKLYQICKQSVTTNTTDLTEMYFKFLVRSICKANVSDYVEESYTFINQAITYLYHRDLFKPVKIVRKRDLAGVKVSGGFRSASMFANMKAMEISNEGSVIVGNIADDCDPSKLVSLSYSEIFDIDLSKALKSDTYPKGFAKSVKYRAKASGLSVQECLCDLAKSSATPLLVSDKLSYVSVKNVHGDLKIGHLKL